MKIKELLSNAGKILPYIALTLGTPNYLMAVEAKKARLDVANSETSRLLTELKAKQDILIAKQAIKNKIAGISADVTDHLNNTSYHTRIIEGLVQRLNNGNINQREQDFITNLIKTNTEQKIESLEKANKGLQDIIDLTTSNTTSNNYIEQFKF
jgi:hypothetical protein